MLTDLLAKVQPDAGCFAIVGIKGKQVTQELVGNREEADKLIERFVAGKKDVYFGVAKYKTKESRVKQNVHALKSFWLDIDCGEKKAIPNKKTGIPDGYATQVEALEALQAFCKLIGLPKPIIVNSGRGLHIYWALTEEVSRERWEPVAQRIRELCQIHKLYVDPAVFEVARILRVPGTFNFKDTPPKPVEVVIDADPVSYDTLRNLLGVNEQKPVLTKRPLTALAKSLVNSSVTSFSKIMRRSAKGGGCAQLLDCYNQRETLTEPRWFDALSIAKFCVDRDKAIHKISEDHEDYDYANTESKTRHILGPHSCEQFEQNNPGGCEGCPFKGKIKSPISLGKEVPEAENNVVVDTPEAVDGWEDTEEPSEYVIPEYPFPFYRGEGGGIYQKPESDEEDPIQIYENDLYVVKRMHDPNEGDVVVMRAHMPKDGIKEFVVPNTSIVDKRELKSGLARQGIMCSSEKMFGLLAHFINRSVKELQFKRRAERMRTQFGWADNDSKFIIGSQEVSVQGVFHSPPSSATATLATYMGTKGTLDKWKEVFNLYGQVGLEPHAFAALSAFGSPLLKFTGQQGAILNVIHPQSGTGKTTILHMCNSVIGDPERLCAIKEDTANAKIIRLGLMNNLCYTVDEITNMRPEDFSNLVYCMSQGRGKDKAERHSNTLKLNLISWQALGLCSGNSSFAEKMAAHKVSPDGELMRLIEYKIDPSDVIEPTFAKKMFDHQLKENYGHAGVIYATYLINNLEEVRALVASIQQKIDRELNLTNRERFWSSIIASNIAGGLIAKHLKLIDWDMQRIYKWTTGMLLGLREDTKPPATNDMSIVGGFINKHSRNLLQINDNVDRRTGKTSAATVEPFGPLLIRHEPDTSRIYIAVQDFREFCADRQINYKEIIKNLTTVGAYLKTENKRLSKGWGKLVAPPVRCIVLDATADGFEDVMPTPEDEDDS